MGIEVTILPASLGDNWGDNPEDSLDRLLTRVEQWTDDTVSALERDGWESIWRGRHVKFAHPDVRSIGQAKKRLRSLGIDPGPCIIREFKYVNGTPNLKRAFKRMRKQGLVVKEDYRYCPDHALVMLGKVAEDRHRSGKALTRYVYYNGQSANDLHDGKDFSLQFGAFHTSPRLSDGYAAITAAGRVACECLRSEEVEYEWDDDPDHAIKVRTRSVEFKR